MHSYQPKQLTEEIKEAVDLWRLGVPKDVDLAEVELCFARYDRAIDTLHRSGDPNYDIVEAELRGYRQNLQEQVDQRLRATGDLE